MHIYLYFQLLVQFCGFLGSSGPSLLKIWHQACQSPLSLLRLYKSEPLSRQHQTSGLGRCLRSCSRAIHGMDRPKDQFKCLVTTRAVSREKALGNGRLRRMKDLEKALKSSID
jgi:hypothetical protein